MLKKRKFSIVLLLLIIGLSIYYLTIAYRLMLNHSPDELLRYKIPLYIYNHGALPVGTNKEVMLAFGNYSYAYYPQLLGGFLSALFMKIMAFFSTKSSLLVFAARWTSVLMGALSVYYIAKSCKILTKNNLLSYAIVIIVGLLPQFVYLSAYVNNDIIVIAGVSIMIYALILATEKVWCYRSAVTFALGVVICLLGYLNSIPFVFLGICYAFILLGIQVKSREITLESGIKVAIVALIIVLITTSPLYIRNYSLYHDFTGTKAFDDAYHRWLKSGGGQTMAPYPGSIVKMIFDSKWIVTTFKSMVCLFGYMSIETKTGYYIFYLLFFYTGLLFFIALLNAKGSKNRTSNKVKLLFNGLMFLGIVLTILLSMYRSVTTDYQPQGRYILTVLPIISIWWVEGMNKFEIYSGVRAKYLSYVAILFYMLVSIVCVFHYVMFNPMLVG